MKKTILSSLLLAVVAGAAQTQAYLDANNVRALILNRNDMFWNPSTGAAAYEVPKGSGKHANFLGALWIGGLDAGGQLHMAGMTYRQNGFDFWPGPLDTVNAATTASISAAYDRIWKINRKDVDDFKTAWASGAVTAGTYTVPADILSWPGNGSLTAGYAAQLAPYVDVNADGIYSPQASGDYPVMKGDQMIFYIVNDNLNIHSETQGLPLGIEMYVTAYSYSCSQVISSFPALNNTTFYHYKVINRSSNTYTNTVAGIFSDVDLGHYNNDYVGCSPGDRLGFAFNAVATDGTYGSSPPIISYQVLRGPTANPGDGVDNDHDGTTDEIGEETIFSSFMFYNNNIGMFPHATVNPTIASDYYGYLNATWKDGRPLRADSSGYLSGSSTVAATPYAYPGDPSVPSGWTEYSKSNPAGDRRFIIGNGPFTLGARGSFELEYSILTTFGSGQNGYRDIPLVKQENATILNFYRLAEKPECAETGTVTGLDVHARAETAIIPNPVSSTFRLELPVPGQASKIRVYNAMGQEHATIATDEAAAVIDATAWPRGIYIVIVEGSGYRQTLRLVKQ